MVIFAQLDIGSGTTSIFVSVSFDSIIILFRFRIDEEERRSSRFVSHSQEEAAQFAKYSTIILFTNLLFRRTTLHFLIPKLVPLDISSSADIASALILVVSWLGFVLTVLPELVTQGTS